MLPFEYRTPKNLKEVHATLKEFGTDAKLLAGGTALVIMMKQRLLRPRCLVSPCAGGGGVAEPARPAASAAPPPRAPGLALCPGPPGGGAPGPPSPGAAVLD